MLEVPDSRRPALPAETARALRTGWFLWGGMGAALALFGVQAYLIGARVDVAPESDGLLGAAAAFLAVEIGVGLVVRSFLWARARRGGVLPPQAWLAGSLVLWAMLEGGAFFTLVVLLIEGPTGGRLVTACVAVLAFAITFPRASAIRAMEGGASPEDEFARRFEDDRR